MWETVFIIAGLFLALSLCLWIFIGKTARKRHDAIAPGKFDFDSFKSREIARRGVHDTTRFGKKL
ncbi:MULTISPECIES: hypothetical protein [Solidesulfovibrio]|jgi:hypothetical protein|uniref:hypothetical protein n=1 Tax=Solidesulfovibrio TaxID=2910984 RepID=UPI000495A5CC|nr:MULTISPECIES: hypothetical protein [Solidesulfovibrio]MEA5090764.1 hypothetical protein [Solidesulfovibrio sp.]HCR11903.1 hypothetical protein [Desulfovibrio sp.]HML62438.1 hypothetical protein [Solidesulfovibrio sp.]